MSKKANPVTIGLFLILGVALGLVGVLLFSARSLLHPQQKEILYFDSELKGLNPGAPVKFRGVAIGSVTEVLIRHNQSSNDFSMPVVVTIDKKVAQAKSDQFLGIGSMATLDDLIRRGFRGRLESESLVTGVLYVGLEIVPDAPPPVLHQLTSEYHEIPTVPSQIQQLLGNLAHLDLRALAENVNGLVTHLNSSLGQLDVPEINAGVTNLLRAAGRVVSTPDLTNSLVSLRKTLDQAGVLVARVDHHVDPLADSLTTTLADAQKSMAGVRVAVRNAADLLSPDSATPHDLRQALEELSNAGRAVADLAQFLERNPNALLAGRRRSKD